MSWSAPMTAVAGSVFTANQYNTYVRDNLLETGVAKVDAAGQYLVGAGQNAVAARGAVSARVEAAESTTSGSFTNLTTAGPSVTVQTGTNVLVLISSALRNDTTTDAATFVSYDISGATSINANLNWAIGLDGVRGNVNDSNRYGEVHHWESLTPGTNTFTMKYSVGSGTGTFGAREIIVLPL